MQSSRWVFLVAVSAAIGAGCGSKPSLVGEWSGVLPVKSTNVDVGMKCKEGGAWEMNQSSEGGSSNQKGTYALEGDALTVTITHMQTNDMPKEALERVTADLAKSPLKVTFDLSWKGGDTITIKQRAAMAPYDVPMTLMRK